MKTYRTILIILFAIVCANRSIRAQGVDYIAGGLKGGGGICNLRGIDRYTDHIPGTFIEDWGFTTGAYPAIEFGPVMQVMYTNNIMLQSELLISTSGAKFKNSQYVKSVYDLYLTLHMNLGTKIPVNKDFRFVLGAGPFLGYDLSFFTSSNIDYGRDSMEEYPEKANISFDEADYKKIDAGVSAMVGVEYFNWQFTFNYDHGLTNLVDDIHKIQSRKFKLGIVYFFEVN